MCDRRAPKAAKAVTATARKIATVLYNTMRHGKAYVDPGASYYEERYRERTMNNLRRRAGASRPPLLAETLCQPSGQHGALVIAEMTSQQRRADHVLELASAPQPR